MTSLRPLAAALVLAPVAAIAIGCGATSAASDAGPRTCQVDLDCGDHHYCSDASVCTTDCYVDADCLGPTKTAQCNAQGRCVETDLDAMVPEASTNDVGGGGGG